MRLFTAGVATVAATLLLGLPGPVAMAEPADGGTVAAPSASGSLDRIEKIDERRWNVFVYSPSMNEVVELQVLRPADTSVPRPTLYLLNGAGAGEDGANWIRQTDIVDFFADKNANVVIPVGGYISYYTDWRNDDPVLGRNKWQTFLTEELPPVLDAALGADGVNAIGGLSMSAGSVIDLAVQAPGLYRGVASYSGCAMTSDPIGQNLVRLVVEVVGGGNTENMWGPTDDPAWTAHDPYVNADKLRGLELYISNASGLPGPYEALDAVRPAAAPPLPDQIVIGGVIEAATNYCTHRLVDRLDTLGIPATVDFRDTGTHSWGYWQDALHESWPVLARALDL
ncbi:alpha/beta hydrolase family protein [Rhodococcus sp. T2V]|uniref:alpha/beta hydrolase n=1 Tax=Rhodococcus sp. T2V TaxID=3034164 RepID=UPI0023E12F0F|nr:alpha/beta hydrolase family protein [Rhodococcus sp. T2V]MDF3305113.1 alpha/beta hydrolase family protein [Rhodococcus sp. T2V]